MTNTINEARSDVVTIAEAAKTLGIEEWELRAFDQTLTAGDHYYSREVFREVRRAWEESAAELAELASDEEESSDAAYAQTVAFRMFREMADEVASQGAYPELTDQQVRVIAGGFIIAKMAAGESADVVSRDDVSDFFADATRWDG